VPEEAARGLGCRLSKRRLRRHRRLTLTARGPTDIAERLRVGWGDLAAYENTTAS